MNNDEIIAKANDFYEKLNGQRQEEGEGLLVKSHILTLADQPERTILVLMSEEYEDAYIYEPLSDKEQPYNPHYNEPDEILFGYLEEGYEIADMDLHTHAAFWNYISETQLVECHEGLQKYLDYCLQNRITVDKLKSVYDYKFNDLLSFYADAKEDIFLRADSFKDKPWYGDIALYTRIGVCKPKPIYAKEVCRALRQLGYGVTLKFKWGDLYVMPYGKNKKPKETDAR